MASTPLGWVDYPPENDTSWYSKAEDGLELWLERLELLGIPTYTTFADLPAPDTPVTRDTAGIEQRQFAAVAADRTIYRVNSAGDAWETFAGAGTSARPMPGTVYRESVTTDDLDINGKDVASTGDFLGIGPSWGPIEPDFSTTSTAYVQSQSQFKANTRWDRWAPAGATTAVMGEFEIAPGTDESVSVRLRFGNAYTAFELTNITVADQKFPVEDFTPGVTNDRQVVYYQAKTDTGTNALTLSEPFAHAGVQV